MLSKPKDSLLRPRPVLPASSVLCSLRFQIGGWRCNGFVRILRHESLGPSFALLMQVLESRGFRRWAETEFLVDIQTQVNSPLNRILDPGGDG